MDFRLPRNTTKRVNRAGAHLVCEICHRVFPKVDHLDRHRRSHTKEKPFKCNICGKYYSRHDTLLRHSRGHNGADPQVVRLGMETSQHDLSGSREDITTLVNNVNPVVAPRTSPVNPDLLCAAPVSASESGPVTFDSSLQGLDENFPPWLLTDTFNVDSLDLPFNSVVDAVLDSRYFIQDHYGGSVSPTGQPIRKVSDLRDIWFTNMSNTGGYQSTPYPASPVQTEVDESYRRALHHRISVRPSEHQLPSADFLNSCIRLYFRHFQPLLPIIHRPTFQPSSTTAALLLSMCSIGCLFTTPVDAFKLGTQLYENLQKASMAMWETIMSRSSDEALALVQASLVGQSFGILSGDPKHLAQIDALHGTAISWARRLRIFKADHVSQDVVNLSGPELSEAWQRWVRTEVNIRIRLCLYVQDAELAHIFRHEPLLRRKPLEQPLCAPEEVFMAANAENWKVQYLRFSVRDLTNNSAPPLEATSEIHFMKFVSADRFLSIYAILEDITVEILEYRISNKLDESAERFLFEKLHIFHHCFLKADSLTHNLTDLHILWHLAFMETCTDFNQLESALGRDGPLPPQHVHEAVALWASSPSATRCLLHSGQILKLLQAQPLNYNPALHTARALFLAGLSWCAFTKFAPSQVDAVAQTQTCTAFREFTLLDINTATLLLEIHGFRTGPRPVVDYNGLLGGAAGLLTRLGNWRVALRFSEILFAVIHDLQS